MSIDVLGGRIGVVGDVHTLDHRLERALDTLTVWGATTVLQVGDILDGDGDAERTVRLLREREVVAIAGNHDRWFLEGYKRDKEGWTKSLSESARAFIADLPATRRLNTDAGGILVCHGIGDDDLSMLKSDTRGYALQSIFALRPLIEDPDIAFMVCGHTHERMIRHFQGLTVLNAGTLHDNGPCGIIGVDFDAMAMTSWNWVEDEFVLAVDHPVQSILAPSKT